MELLLGMLRQPEEVVYLAHTNTLVVQPRRFRFHTVTSRQKGSSREDRIEKRAADRRKEATAPPVVLILLAEISYNDTKSADL